MTLLVALLAGIFPIYTQQCVYIGKIPIAGKYFRYISLAVPLILEATMIQVHFINVSNQ